VPLGVLSLGAIFAGMIWLGPFFGEPEQVNAFFGIEATAEAAAGTATDTATTAPATTETAAAAQYVAPTGAIYMAPDNTVLADAHESPAWVKVSPFIAMVLGFFVAWVFYIRKPDWPARLAVAQRPLYLFLLNKWYFDEIYGVLIVRPMKWLARFLWKRGDGNVIDGGLNGLALGLVPRLTRLAGRMQSGYLFHYAFAMVIGITILITVMTLGGGAG